MTPEATLRGQATEQLRDAALWLRWAQGEDDAGYEENADSDRHPAALAWLRREALIAAQRQLATVTRGAIVLPGWTCTLCGGWNGEEKERMTTCRCCGGTGR